jgi:hypothetical protein
VRLVEYPRRGADKDSCCFGPELLADERVREGSGIGTCVSLRPFVLEVEFLVPGGGDVADLGADVRADCTAGGAAEGVG